MKPETKVQIELVSWLRSDRRCLNILFFAPLNELNRENPLFYKMGGLRGASDLWILEDTEEYKGLVIEIKCEGDTLYRRDGTCKYPEQLDFLEKMRLRGWRAEFSCGYKATKKLIEDYLDI